MSLPQYNFEFVSGETFKLEITYKDSSGSVINLTSGYRVDIDGRTDEDSSSTLFAVDSTTSAITLGSSGPNISLVLDATTTGGISAPTSGVYDVKVNKTSATPDEITYILGGKFTVTKAITA
tara:strand:- start:174 stop:539 length:366 start_codon:yes stop_codon:yes gene_type:complete